MGHMFNQVTYVISFHTLRYIYCINNAMYSWRGAYA